MIPLLGTDYFTKPEPQGSINSTVMRIMASAGAAVGERVEKAQTQLEARLLAPQITQGYAGAYKKIADGDFSGFSDMASVKALAAANPLLASLSKDADQLGIHIANNVTQREILSERMRSQTAMIDQRAAHASDLVTQRGDEQEAGRVDRENAAIEKRNELRRSAFQHEKALNPNAQMEPLEPLVQFQSRGARTSTSMPSGGTGRVSTSSSSPSGGVVTNPLGIVERNNPDPAEEEQVTLRPPPGFKGVYDASPESKGAAEREEAQRKSAPAGSEAAQAIANKGQETDLEKLVKDDEVSAIMERDSIMATDFESFQSEAGNRVSLTRSSDGQKIVFDGDDAKLLIDKVSKMYAEKSGADPKSSVGHTIPPSQSAVSANPMPAKVAGKKVDEIEFGNVRFQIDSPSEEDSMRMKQVTIHSPGADKVYASEDFGGKEGHLKDRTKFIEAIGTMKTDPNAAAFVSDHLNDKGRGGVVFKQEEYDNGGKGKVVLRARMYGIDENGKPVPFNPGGDDGKTPDFVSGDFVRAYGDALKVMQSVKGKYNTKVLRDEKQAEDKPDPWAKFNDSPDVKAAALKYKAEFEAKAPSKNPAAIEAWKKTPEGSAALQVFNEKVSEAIAESRDAKERDNKYGTYEEMDAAIAKEDKEHPIADFFGFHGPKRVEQLKFNLNLIEKQLEAYKKGKHIDFRGREVDGTTSAAGFKRLAVIRDNIRKKIKAASE